MTKGPLTKTEILEDLARSRVKNLSVSLELDKICADIFQKAIDNSIIAALLDKKKEKEVLFALDDQHQIDRLILPYRCDIIVNRYIQKYWDDESTAQEITEIYFRENLGEKYAYKFISVGNSHEFRVFARKKFNPIDYIKIREFLNRYGIGIKGGFYMTSDGWF